MDKKISALTEKVTIAGTDYLVLVDESASPTTKKMLAGNFLSTKSPSIFVASSTATASEKLIANYICDGVNDDVEINAALNSLPANGGRVILSEGTFVLGNSITMKSFQRLEGQGKGTIITPSSGSTYDLIIGTLTPTYNRYTDVLNLKIDCSNQTSGNAINIYAPRNNLYRSLWFTSVKGSCINLAGDASNLGWYNWIVECEVDGVPGDGITSPAYCEHAYILYNTITFVSGYGIHVQSDTDLIQGNSLDFCGKISILCEFGAGEWRIYDNFIDRPQDHGIVIRSAINSTVSRNHFGSPAAGKALITNGLFGSDASNGLIATENQMAVAGGAGSFGIEELGGLTDKCIYAENIITGPTTAISVNASSTNLQVRNNEGFNPQGIASISVGGSPYTYTCGVTHETVYISGGTVSNVSKGGSTVSAQTNCTIDMQPNETIIVTYSSIPTMIKDRH